MKNKKIPLKLLGQAVIIVLGAFGSMLSSTLLNTALPMITQSFSTTSSMSQWVATGYFLSLAASVPLSGYISKKMGPTKLWLSCLVFFLLFSVACALSTNIYMLIFFRVLQGVAGGLLVPAGQVITSIIAGKEMLGRVVSIIGIVIVLAPTIGTSLSNVILYYFDWPWLFWINVPISLLAFGLGVKFLPDIKMDGSDKFDWIGFILITSGLPIIIYSVTSFASNTSGFDFNTLIMFVLGFVLITLFIVTSLRNKDAILNLGLLNNRVFSAAVCVMFLGGAISFGAQVMLPHYLLDVKSMSFSLTSSLMLFQIIGTAVGFPLSGTLTDKFGAGKVIFIGSSLLIIDSIFLLFLNVSSSVLVISILYIIWGVASAMTTIPAMTAGLLTVSQRETADAAPLLNMMQRVGASFGTATVSIFYLRKVTGLSDPINSLDYFRNTLLIQLFVLLVLILLSIVLISKSKDKY